MVILLCIKNACVTCKGVAILNFGRRNASVHWKMSQIPYHDLIRVRNFLLDNWNIKHLSNNHICDTCAGFATFAQRMVSNTKMDFMEAVIKVKDGYYGSITPAMSLL